MVENCDAAEIIAVALHKQITALTERVALLETKLQRHKQNEYAHKV